jgi:hypothetical protein
MKLGKGLGLGGHKGRNKAPGVTVCVLNADTRFCMNRE